jgi:hypothetical protein
MNTAFLYASTTRYLRYWQSCILLYYTLHSFLTGVVGLPERYSSLPDNFPAFKVSIHLKIVRFELPEVYATQFIIYLPCSYINPNAALNIASNFSFVIHYNQYLNIVYDCIYLELKYTQMAKIKLL